MSVSRSLRIQDPDIAQLINLERVRQQNHIELIASENFVSQAVLEAQGSILTNKYAEGYPSKRYYGGCTHVDEIETLAIQRACAIFECAYANVQPHSGSQANQGVFYALLQPGDKIMGMDLSAGGHLTHGSSVNISGKWFQSFSYAVNPDTHRIEIEEVAKLAQQHCPKLIIAGGSSYPRIIDFKKFRAIADSIGAYLLVDMAHFAGLVATKHYPSPFPHAHIVTSTTHKTLRGPRGGLILSNDPEIMAKINKAIFPGIQGGPLLHVIAAKAVAFQEASQPTFKDYSQAVIKNAKALGQILQDRGFQVSTQGTDTHLLIVNVANDKMDGQEAEIVLEKAGLTCNKNAIPFDKRPAIRPSGIRLGTPAETTRGLMEKEFQEIGYWIADILEDPENSKIKKVKSSVSDLCSRFPLLYP